MSSGHFILDLLWLLFLLLLLRHFIIDKKILAKSQRWSITKGTITELHWTQEGHRLWPKIHYHYQVNEEEYQGEYLFLETSHNSHHSSYARHLAYRIALALDKKREVEVFYNPDYPQQSALDIRIPKKLNVIIFLLIFLIVFHLMIIAYRLWALS